MLLLVGHGTEPLSHVLLTRVPWYEPMSEKELAKLYKCSVRSIRRYKLAGAPLDNQAEMERWIADRRSRQSIGKYSPRKPTKAEVIVPAEVIEPPTLPSSPDEGTLARLREAERKPKWLP